ncbi:MAG: hypothetical protein EBZ67_14735, partial [Chitinophagia bacterium]|nr:hypothetical protein [Chitinophagia bacterium]
MRFIRHGGTACAAGRRRYGAGGPEGPCPRHGCLRQGHQAHGQRRHHRSLAREGRISAARRHPADAQDRGLLWQFLFPSDGHPG